MQNTIEMTDNAPLLSRHQIAVHPIAAEARFVCQSGDYSRMLSSSAQLAKEARRSKDHELLALELSDLAQEGSMAALVAIEILAQLNHHYADDALVDLLSSEEQTVRRHASWRLGERAPSPATIPALLDMLILGGIDTLHAHRTLRSWSAFPSKLIAWPTIDRLVTERNPAARARIVDLLGVVGPEADNVLLQLALEGEEALCVRAAAVGALGERSGARIDAALNQLAALDEPIGTYAALALRSRVADTLPLADRPRSSGLRIVQLVLAEGLDRQLSLGGRGDTGGVASLLVSLGEALADRDDVDHVLTIGRGTVAEAARRPVSTNATPLSYCTLAIGDPGREIESPNDTWEYLPAIERGIRRELRLAGPVDVLHLRMADAGTLAGAYVAAAAGIRTCFSAAPDPHNVIESLQARGELNDQSFVQLDTQLNIWFRARMIEQVARGADQLALFPRSKKMDFLSHIGTDAARRDQRIAVVAEGIDIKLLDSASEAATNKPAVTHRRVVLDDLAEMIEPLRRGLPLVVSVGRFNPVKGMERVVSAWATNPNLHETCNLVIVGGDLADPTTTERGVLDEINRLVPITDSRRSGLVLLGGRPRADVAQLLVSAASGRDGDWDSGGVYVDGALKEEFGLAVLEAMAAGLVVVAPSTGGPSTYVDHGDTGVLVDPGTDLAGAVREAFGLIHLPGRPERARTMVEERYSIAMMAAQLTELYRPGISVQ
ncbi:MAG: glycosyltransferase [Halioglobus sp.]